MSAEQTPSGSSSANSVARSIIILLIVLALAALIAWAGSQNGAEINGWPLFAVLVVAIFLVQVLAFIPAWLKQTEHYYDLTGSVTYILAAILAVALSGHTDLTALLLMGMVVVWAGRLGPFLFRRVRKSGGDDRFDEIKPNFMRFLNVWVIQGLWIAVTGATAFTAITALERPETSVLTFIGIGLWLIGFAVEVVADNQKSKFKADPSNQGKFISTGLWSRSRHPNYFGEIVLWIGVAIAAFPALSGWQYATLISPVFVVVLLTRISGVPMLERKAEAKWGGKADYEEYKAKTPTLIPAFTKK